MLCASPTGCLDLFAQRLAGAEHAHAGVVGCDSGLAGEFLNCNSVDFHSTDRCFVLWFEGLSETRDAAADRVMEVRGRFDGVFHLAREQLEGAAPSPLMPIVIDDS